MSLDRHHIIAATKKINFIIVGCFCLAAPAVGAAEPLAEDAVAERFVLRCSGCHTIGGGPLKGPDLQAATQWPTASLELGVKKMEKHVGPLAPSDVTAFVELLKDTAVRARLDAARQRAAQAMAAKLEPPSIEQGQALFSGRQALSAGGLACATCHRLAGDGGALGPDLTNLGRKMDAVGMVSAFEQANFPVMRAAYAERKVTKQEALHLAAFIGAAKLADGEEPPTSTTSLTFIGGGVALGLVAFALLVSAVSGGRANGTRRRLIDRANAR